MNSEHSDQINRDSQSATLAWGWRWRLWLLALAVWTVGLLIPFSGRSGGGFGDPTITRKFIAAKSAHVFAYLFLTWLASIQHASLRVRRWLLLCLVLHAPLSEWFQRFASNRTGRVLDVAFDFMGLIAGLLLTWNSWWDPDHDER